MVAKKKKSSAKKGTMDTVKDAVIGTEEVAVEEAPVVEPTDQGQAEIMVQEAGEPDRRVMRKLKDAPLAREMENIRQIMAEKPDVMVFVNFIVPGFGRNAGETGRYTVKNAASIIKRGVAIVTGVVPEKDMSNSVAVAEHPHRGESGDDYFGKR